MDHLKERLRRDFKKAHERHKRITDTPVTKKELSAREKLREEPTHDFRLEPGGITRREIDPSGHAENERRIQFLHKRLGRMKDRARNDFRCGR